MVKVSIVNHTLLQVFQYQSIISLLCDSLSQLKPKYCGVNLNIDPSLWLLTAFMNQQNVQCKMTPTTSRTRNEVQGFYESLCAFHATKAHI